MQTDKWTCQQCGKENDENFCIYCGTARNPNDEIFEWICPKCGRRNNDLFCEKCGTFRNSLKESQTLNDDKVLSNDEEIRNIQNPKIAESEISTNAETTTENTTYTKEDETASDTSESISQNHIANETLEWICPECGRKNSDLFCEKCGTSRKKINFSPDEISDGQNVVQNIQSSINHNDTINTSPSTPLSQVEEDKSKKLVINSAPAVQSQSSDNKKFFYAGCIFALVIAICFMGFQIFNQLQDENTSEIQPNSSQQSISQEVPKTEPSEVSSNQSEKVKVPEKIETPSETPKTDTTIPSPEATPTPREVKTFSPQVSDSLDIANAANENQKSAIKSFYDFHKNITEHKLQNAYSFFSPGMQEKMTYEGWVPGFNTTVSSTPSDVKVLSESESRIVLTYYLQAIDNPGGTQNFTGTVVMIKVGDSWKIDDVTNKIK